MLWYVLGAMSGATAMVVLLPVTRGLRHRAAWIGGAGVAVVAVAFVLYLVMGAPQWADASRMARAPASPHTGASEGNGGAPGSLDEAAARLAARLATGDGRDDDWELLARTYEALGDVAAASAARTRRLPDDATKTEPAAPAATASAADWADYADRLAASRGRSLQGEPAGAIAEALKRDPRNAKALWLAASLSLERRDYAGALRGWQELRSVLPEGSPDLAIVDANIAETRELQGGSPPTPAASASGIAGTVDLDPALRSAADRGRTLFVYARAAQAGGAPLAALRVAADRWPVRFRLDEGAVMLPGASLAGVSRVFVEARLSASGTAGPSPGDLIGEGAWASTQGGEVTLHLTRRRP